MFLKELSLEEKKAFLEVADKLIGTDNVKTNEEMCMILQYQDEMNLPAEEYRIGTLTYESSVEKLNKMDKVKKNKVFFELIALAMCDNEYSIQEEEYIKNLQKVFSVNNEEVDGFIKCVKEINTVYKKLGELING